MKEFPIEITETLKMTVHVEAETAEAAKEIASERWDDGEYVLDADHFVGADFAVTDTALELGKHPDIQELKEILKSENLESPLKELTGLVDYVSSLEKQYSRMADELSEMRSMMASYEKRSNPIQETVSKAITHVENKLADVKEKIDHLKERIADGARNAVESFKQKGISALNSALGFLKIRENLAAISDTLSNVEKQLNSTVAKLDQLEQKAQKPSVIDNLHSMKESVKSDVKAPDKPKQETSL